MSNSLIKISQVDKDVSDHIVKQMIMFIGPIDEFKPISSKESGSSDTSKEFYLKMHRAEDCPAVLHLDDVRLGRKRLKIQLLTKEMSDTQPEDSHESPEEKSIETKPDTRIKDDKEEKEKQPQLAIEKDRAPVSPTRDKYRRRSRSRDRHRRHHRSRSRERYRSHRRRTRSRSPRRSRSR